MSDFDQLKKNRSNSLDKLTQKLNEIASKSYSNPDEDKYWKPTRDAAGNGFAIIRFLPAKSDEDIPFIKTYDHGFQGPTGLWYIENSLNTLGQPDPVGDYNSKLWNSGVESDKEIARKQKRRTNFVSNIYVIKDSGKPENEGKNFWYKYGKKIYDKINDSMNPAFEDEAKVNPFDLWEGANFRLTIKTVDQYPNYDKSRFDAPAPLFEDEEKLRAVYDNIMDLNLIKNPKNFKTYEELEAKLHRVLGLTGAAPKTSSARAVEEEDDLAVGKTLKEKSAPKEKEAPAKVDVAEDDEDELAFFRSLASK